MKQKRAPYVLSVAVAAAIGNSVADAQMNPVERVAVSILPIQSLVANVTQGIQPEPELLIPPTASPHGHALRPSEARALARADLIVWVGEGIETPMARLLRDKPAEQVLKLVDTVNWPVTHVIREGGVWEEHLHDHGSPSHEHEHSDGHSHGHDHGDKHSHGHDHGDKHSHGHDHGDKHSHGHDHVDFDQHLWLSPLNAIAIVETVADLLAKRDPTNAERYAANRDATIERIQALDAELQAKLAPVRDRPFIVFHDAYQYFERHYDLRPAGSITLDPTRQPGAQRIATLRDRLRADDVACVFSEPQFRPALVQTLIEGTSTRAGELDPIGAAHSAGVDAWFNTMRSLGDAFVECVATEG
ncbi:MAG: zinc ABC transporter substrate-binding protein [Thioalkalivibrionaceae bacterium]